MFKRLSCIPHNQPSAAAYLMALHLATFTAPTPPAVLHSRQQTRLATLLCC